MSVIEIPAYEFARVGTGEKTMTSTIQMIPRAALKPSPTNPRKKFDPEKLRELAETIKQHGVLEPLLVRVLFANRTSGEYEIIAGERRWRASEIVGLTKVPCIVKELSDEQVLEIQYIENLQRQDLTAVEEAEGFQKLIESKAYTAETLAQKLGKSRSHIFSRLKLCKLAAPLREAVNEGKISHLIAEELARVPGECQAEALKDVTSGREPMSVRQARKYLKHNFTANLENAPWPLEDRKLIAEAGACNVCPKRSGNCREEYPDIKSPNVCTDLACYRRKKDGYRAQLLAEESKRGKVLTIAEHEEAFSHGWISSESCWTQLDHYWLTTVRGRVSAAQVLKEPKSDRFAAVNPQFQIIHLYRKEDLKMELAARGYAEQEREPEAPMETAEERAKRELKQKLEREIQEKTEIAVGEAVIAKLPKLADVKVWLLVLRGLWNMDMASEAVAERYGLESKLFYRWDTLEKAISKWPAEKLKAFTLEISLRDYDGFVNDAIDMTCDWLKIDRKQIAKDVRKELTAAARATLVHKVTHGVPLPGEKKKSNSGMTPEEWLQQEGIKGTFTLGAQA